MDHKHKFDLLKAELPIYSSVLINKVYQIIGIVADTDAMTWGRSVLLSCAVFSALLP